MKIRGITTITAPSKPSCIPSGTSGYIQEAGRKHRGFLSKIGGVKAVQANPEDLTPLKYTGKSNKAVQANPDALARRKKK